MSFAFRRAGHVALAAAIVAAGVIMVAVVSTSRLQPRAMAEPDNGNCPNTAAAAFGWGTPNRVDDFSDAASLESWGVYDSPGHNGNGRRTPKAMSVSNGVLTITGDSAGNSGGMAWMPGQMYGRWEVCAKSPAAAPDYHSVLLLWPDVVDWPAGGEIDFMEATEPARQSVEGWLHYGADDDKVNGDIHVDATQWHSWAVEWTHSRIAMYLDGKVWWETTDTAQFPPGPMHLCLQLDNFGADISQGGQMLVDWTRQYPA
ncbi:glycoside hydrolase family 16 protein [Mycolicibacterium brisbanense]|uniref:Glycoside hydrolase family protein n=1 Tax=Mycolicibacterium brisbanense TaxID=146020 RepID=A0A100VVM8_9MYCO|nr:glycoside hydrolase family 16 protein [Mycolicibacterium brisbanense]MCV7160681.1 glycoside hydrolase family 16 protein [Mycolicibacterium brisbanense]GAS86911.1 glycoside hydrolase family protein [Mycolicibacterium brisbanense]